MDDKPKVINMDRYGFFFKIGNIIALVIGTVYFVVFVYQMRDAIQSNIVANNENQKQLIATQEKAIKATNRVSCLLWWHISQEHKPYKGECDRMFEG